MTGIRTFSRACSRAYFSVNLVTILMAMHCVAVAQNSDTTPPDSTQKAQAQDQYVHFFMKPIDTSKATTSPMKQVRDSNGLFIIDFAFGKGAPSQDGKRHFVRFVGLRANESIFDSTYSGMRLFSFVRGKDEVVKGLELGVISMRCGGRRRISVPPNLAYGDKGNGEAGIRPRERITFDVELVAIE